MLMIDTLQSLCYDHIERYRSGILAPEGRISMMKKLKKQFGQLPQALQAVLLIMAAAVLSFVIETCVFHFSWFTQNQEKYPETELDLSSVEGWNGEAVAVLPESATVSFDELPVSVRSVTVRTSGPSEVLSGTVGICDEANAYRTVGAASFQVNPGGTQNSFTVRLDSRGTLARFRITFTDEPSAPVFLLSVTLNARQPFTVNFLRFFLMTAVLAAIFLAARFRLARREYQQGRWDCRLLNAGVLVLCLLICGFVFYAQNAEHSMLRPYPTLEEIRSPEMVVDVYMQQLDAFEKGQIALDLDVNPELETLDNPYDRGERVKKEIAYHWDRAYYNGTYYSYFGLAPLFMVYYPIFWLTGMLPTTAFAGFLLTAFTILMIFAAVQGLMRLFAPRANLLLFLLGEFAVVCGSFLYLLEASSSSFYYLPLISGIGWLAAFLALASFAFCACRSVSQARTASGSVSLQAASLQNTSGEQSPWKAWKRVLLFALCGISLVMIVLSRPNIALLAAAFAAPLFLMILLDKGLSWRQRLLESAFPFLIPVVIGAAAIMYYNYIRFDSLFEFGTSYQLTESDIRWNDLTLSLHHFASMLYHYFIEPFVYTEFFPFLRFTSEKCVDFGNYLYQECSAGLFQMPLNLGIFLLAPVLLTRSREKKDSRKKIVLTCLLLGILTLGYVNFLMGGIHIRYVCDLSLALSLSAFLLILDQVHYDNTRSARILYFIVLCALLITIGRGLLLIFSNELNNVLLNFPDLYLKISRIFHG